MHAVSIILIHLASQVAAGVIRRDIITVFDVVTAYVTAEPVTAIATPTEPLVYASWLPGILGHIPIPPPASTAHTTSSPTKASIPVVHITPTTLDSAPTTTAETPAPTTTSRDWNAVFDGFGPATLVTLRI